MSPLLYACRGGHPGLAELLISVNADINTQDSRGWTVSSVMALKLHGRFRGTARMKQTNKSYFNVQCRLVDVVGYYCVRKDQEHRAKFPLHVCLSHFCQT